MPRKIPQIISQEEFEKLLAYTLKQKKKNSKTYALAMLLAFEAGMRISELVGWKGISRRINKKTGEVVVKDTYIPPLTKDMINFEQNTIKLKGKGGKERVVPLPKRVNKNALNLLPLKLSRRSFQNYVTKTALKVLEKHITFHTQRHGFATHYYNKTQDIRGLQVMLGHSRADTTAIYAHVNPEKVIQRARDVF